MKYLFFALVLLTLAGTGCTPDVPPPPLERNDLVVRFFRSLRNNEGVTATLQGQKLHLMDKRNYFLMRLIAIQQANNHVRDAQRALNAGNLEKAINELVSGLRRFPDNPRLHKELDTLRKLRHAEKHFIAMRSAPNPAAMNSALAAAQAGLSGLESPQLAAFFAEYKKSIQRWNKLDSGKKIPAGKVPIRSFDDK